MHGGAQRALELVHGDAKLPQFELFLLKSEPLLRFISCCSSPYGQPNGVPRSEVGIHEKYLGPLCLLLEPEAQTWPVPYVACHQAKETLSP